MTWFALWLEAPPAPHWLGLTVDDWIKAAAVVVGGVWTWLNHVRGRTFRKKADIELPGTVREGPGVKYFVGDCRAKNVGSSRIPIKSYGTVVSVYTMRLRDLGALGWMVAEEEVVALPLVMKDAWIEPGETFNKPYVVALPEGEGYLVGVRTEAMINNGQTVWTVSQVTDVVHSKKVEIPDA